MTNGKGISPRSHTPAPTTGSGTSLSPTVASATARLSDFSLTGEQRADAVADLKQAVAEEEATR